MEQLQQCSRHHSTKLKVKNPEPILPLLVTDNPGSDAEGHEVDVAFFQAECRVSGGELWYLIDECVGGTLDAGAAELIFYVKIQQFLDLHAAEIMRAERAQGRQTVVPKDGAYLFRHHAVDSAGLVSASSSPIKLNLQLTPSDPPGPLQLIGAAGNPYVGGN